MITYKELKKLLDCLTDAELQQNAVVCSELGDLYYIKDVVDCREDNKIVVTTIVSKTDKMLGFMDNKCLALELR